MRDDGGGCGGGSKDRSDLYKLIDIMIEKGEEALRLTPELLPVLKEAGVVDSGGKGLITILRGFKMVIDGEDVDEYVIILPLSGKILNTERTVLTACWPTRK